MILPLGTPYVDPGATAADLRDGDLTDAIVSNLTVNPHQIGIYTNTYTVTDSSGNTARATRTVVVVLVPKFAGCVITAPGQLRLHGLGIVGLTYTVQVSTNLVDWVDHARVTAGPEGVIEYVEPMGKDTPARFYRLKWPQEQSRVQTMAWFGNPRPLAERGRRWGGRFMPVGWWAILLT